MKTEKKGQNAKKKSPRKVETTRSDKGMIERKKKSKDESLRVFFFIFLFFIAISNKIGGIHFNLIPLPLTVREGVCVCVCVC